MGPLIGVTPDFQESGGYSKFPWYALRKNHTDVLSEEGGLPVILPYDGAAIHSYLECLCGILITGGDCDVPPSFYGQDTQHPSIKVKHNRTSFERALAYEAFVRKIPILGICGGMQVMNVALGGTLIQHIPDAIPNALAHEQKNPPNEAGHVVEIKPKTLLSEIVGVSEMPVNTSHHQSIDRLGEGAITNAHASDGIIEGFEVPSHPFFLGVQWHPEFIVSNGDRKVFTHFIKACTIYAQANLQRD